MFSPLISSIQVYLLARLSSKNDVLKIFKLINIIFGPYWSLDQKLLHASLNHIYLRVAAAMLCYAEVKLVDHWTLILRPKSTTLIIPHNTIQYLMHTLIMNPSFFCPGSLHSIILIFISSWLPKTQFTSCRCHLY